MTKRSYRTFQALILAGLGIYLLSKVIDGRILLYINQRFVILILLASFVFLFLAQLAMRERISEDGVEGSHDHSLDGETNLSGWVLWLLALPIIIGLFSPERPLSSNALQIRGINVSSSLSVQQGATDALGIPSSQRSVLDWIRVVNQNPDGEGIIGEKADVTGFVYHDTRLGKNQFMVSRFSIACCVADAIAMGMVVNWPDASNLVDNQWVRVIGTSDLLALEGKPLPVINADQVELIPEPEQPYLFP